MNSRGVDRLPSIVRTAGAACARARSPESPPGIANTDPESSRPGTAYEADLRAMHHGWRPNCYAAGFPTPRDLCLTANDPLQTSRSPESGRCKLLEADAQRSRSELAVWSKNDHHNRSRHSKNDPRDLWTKRPTSAGSSNDAVLRVASRFACCIISREAA